MRAFMVLGVLTLVVILGGCIPQVVAVESPQAEPAVRRVVARQPAPSPAPEVAQTPAPELAAERTGNVTIVVDRIAVSTSDLLHLGAIWRYVDEQTVIAGGGEILRRNGVRSGVARQGFSVALQAALSKVRTKETQQLMITTLSGSPGMISMGETAYVEMLRCWTPFGERVLLQRAFVGASLVVEPEILPDDRIRLKLHPHFSQRRGPAIELTDLTTEVVLRHGQPLVLAALDQSRENVAFALFSRTRERQSQQVTVVVTPRIEGLD